MKSSLFYLNALAKNVFIVLRPHILLGFLIKPFGFVANAISLAKWVAKQPKNGIYKDRFSLFRNYDRRYNLYEFVIDKENLKNEDLIYLELGVCTGASFRWWMKNNFNHNSRFYGFDTFEGLPESWGIFFKSGDMQSKSPELTDERGEFIKGLFQDTLPIFLKNNEQLKHKRKVIHLDADLFSSTIFSLAVLYPYLQKGDILFFDEFNVPNHEFLAYKIFTESFYVNLELLGYVNNYYQTSFIVR